MSISLEPSQTTSESPQSLNARLPSDLQLAGEAIRRHRLAVGLSQEQLAEQANVHRNYIGYVERGERNVSLAVLFRLARALGIGLDAMLSGLAVSGPTGPSQR